MKIASSFNLRAFLVRKQPAEPIARLVKAGIGGAIAITTLTLLGQLSDSPLLMAPFGATCVLLFSLPMSPLSQPVNVIAGHLISVLVGLTLNFFLPMEWWSLGLAVGMAISLMALFRVTHPPAGADPIVVFFSSPGWEYFILPVGLGSAALVLIAWLFHKAPPTTTYPSPTQADSGNSPGSSSSPDR